MRTRGRAPRRRDTVWQWKPIGSIKANRSAAVRVQVAANVVEISHHEQDQLLRKLRVVSGFDAPVARFEAAAPDTPVYLDLIERFRLRVALEVWEHNTDQLPDGIARLLAVLVQADPRGPPPKTTL
jgi:hypothetical protein